MKLIKSISVLALLSALLFSTQAFSAPPTNVNGLLGTWTNINANDNGIVKVVVTKVGNSLRFKSYGACSPTPCVHTTVVAYPHSASVSSNTATGFYAFRNSGFKYARFAAKRTGSYLRLDSFNTFASGDSRKNYTATDYFRR